ncbi:AI-2E family transporter [Hyphococcus sp.]|uniref:AI-2E family transporter n=1 Tax=Hyphococcus sp. TaxID=2038636 RepID=UPI003CCC03B7
MAALRKLLPEALPTFPDRAQFTIALSVVIIAIVTLCIALYFSKPLMLPIASAFVLSVLLAPAAHWLKRRSVGDAVGAFIIVALAFGLFAGALYITIQPGAAWLERLPDVIDDAKSKLTNVQEAVDKVQDVSQRVNELTDLDGEQPANEVRLEQPDFSGAIFSSARSLIVQVLFTTVLTYFFLASRRDIQRKLMLMRGSTAGMLKMSRMMLAVEQKVGSYMFTMLLINLGLGAATTLAMIAIGMPSPFVWGALAAFFNFIPYLGPATLVALLSITGIVTFETPIEMATPALVYMALNFIESNFVTPLFIGVRLTISPLAIILNISFWTWLWGPAGAIISIPALVIFKTICDYTEVLRPVGLLIGDSDTFRPVKSAFADTRS